MIADLVQWAEANGAQLSPGITAKSLGTGNIGVVADGSHPDVEISVPSKLVIHANLADSAEYGDSPSLSRLKLYLAKERNNLSNFYRPYFAALPDFDAINLPLTWLAEHQLLLKGTNLGGSIKDHLTKLIEEWWQAVERLPATVEKPATHFMNQKFYYELKFYEADDMYKYLHEYDVANWTSFPAYLWALLILKLRAFPAYLAREDLEKYGPVKANDVMLVPIIDLLNHSPSAKVDWVFDQGKFTFKTTISIVGEVHNNYGMKGNEELLLGYGFVLENNQADTAAVKIKIPEVLVEELKLEGVKLPTISDYTMSVVDTSKTTEETDENEETASPSDGTIFFLSQVLLPPALVLVFSILVRNRWDQPGLLRAKLMGLLSLTQALEAKLELINVPEGDSDVETTVRIYAQSQKLIFKLALKHIKSETKQLFADHKSQLVTLKTVYKYDVKLTNALLLAFGFTLLEDVYAHQFQDQMWLLWLVRCANRDAYVDPESDEGDEDNWLPKWVKTCFDRVAKECEVSPQEIIAYKDIYQQLVPPLAQAVPEVFGKGDWGVKNFILAAKLLDLVSFVRGKDQECIVVEPEAVAKA